MKHILLSITMLKELTICPTRVAALMHLEQRPKLKHVALFQHGETFGIVSLSDIVDVCTFLLGIRRNEEELCLHFTAKRAWFCFQLKQGGQSNLHIIFAVKEGLQTMCREKGNL